MTPPYPPSQSITLTVVFVFFRLLAVDLTTAHECLRTSTTCPPFSSPPSFPFSSSPGCGHPSFQIKCSPNGSLISINDFTFHIFHLDHNSRTLTLYPETPSVHNLTHGSCPSTSLSDPPINLTGSPFRFSGALCSRFSDLPQCDNSNLQNCISCSWDCKLLGRPFQLLKHCCVKSSDSKQGCNTRGDLCKFLLQNQIQIQWDERNDTYFSKCKDCRSKKNGVCGFNLSDALKPFLCLIPNSPTPLSPPWILRDNPNRIVLLCALFIFTCLLLVVAVALLILRYRVLKSSKNEQDSTTLFLHRHGSANLLPPMFSYEELESSTNRFHPRNKIGNGGFGSVYLGQLYDGLVVAVKKLHGQHAATTAAGRAALTKSFCNEILILSSINHPNLVKLHGYCSDPRGLLLVYDYVPNGTLADHLHGSKSLYRKASLTWQVRVDIALQTALALEYLHFTVQPAIVHRDITSSNIFVDKEMRVKVGDFGLSRLLVFPESSSSEYVWTGPQGTPGYLDPDYHKSFQLTEKSDVYSFGVVLFELISGMKAVDHSRDKREVALADMVVSKIQVGALHLVVDPVLILEGETMSTVSAVAELAFQCVAADKDDRPDAKELVAELNRIRNRTRGHSVPSTVDLDASKA
ncbi:PREDICTED: LEAF RUST 10 DISEASE-RESISTANCE LOCUS RECEPTOR-LIKE PROTEIN KINASE-like 1.5 [Nelumbo nucifera]|uniref:Protein kinase domain-containing protein n=2 Tax=Nelumbo nucifera TaxID=4432 RepID=A0A822YT84_NELNU|nr:PREDICTED: LEAF RUST 10 DISEASE-RESISTANCE LOCUS RECEPTOR-LIKE PROTEIN KINASE-like 1.5 [Nelumbo nucifera]DAD34771.1 TPA_asm: hypothetical protein HUJ06_005411 [Nelumbo nucifera]